MRPGPARAYLLRVVGSRVLVSGRVEAVIEGLADDVARLIEWARHGPRLAVVENVAVQPEPPEGLAAFQVR